MNREIHVRICGGLEVKLLRSTRPMESNQGAKPLHIRTISIHAHDRFDIPGPEYSPGVSLYLH